MELGTRYRAPVMPWRSTRLRSAPKWFRECPAARSGMDTYLIRFFILIQRNIKTLDLNYLLNILPKLIKEPEKSNKITRL